MDEFDEKIGAWRARVAAALPNREETVDELEEHLRDQIEALCRGGTEPDDALTQSMARLGEPWEIAREFARVPGSWLPALWSVRAVLALFAVLAAALFVLVAAQYSAGTITMASAMYGLTMITGYLAVLMVGLIGVTTVVGKWRRRLREPEHCELRQAIFRLSVAAGVLVAIGIAIRMVRSTEFPGLARDWASVEVGSGFVLASTLLLLVVQMPAVTDKRVQGLLAVLGMTVLWGGWIFANAITQVPIAWLCGAFVAGQTAVIMLRWDGTPAKPTGYRAGMRRR